MEIGKPIYGKLCQYPENGSISLSFIKEVRNISWNRIKELTTNSMLDQGVKNVWRPVNNSSLVISEINEHIYYGDR